MSALVLVAPLSGWATRLEEIPDPAFAQGMVGDGVAMDPTSNELRAPCDGAIVSIHRARHALTLRADNGAEILLHVGIDTVELHGDGFQVLVAAGQRVRTGEPLLRFDIDKVSRRAKTLHTPVLLVGGDGLAIIERVVDRDLAVGDFLMAIGKVDARGVPEATTPANPSATATRRVRLLLPHGLHARPAAAFARRASQHPGAVTVACRQRTANGKSVAGLMTLDARLGDELAITAEGAQSEATVGELAALVTAGLGDVVEPARTRPSAAHGERERAPTAPSTPESFAPGQEVLLEGAAAAAGLIVGTAVRLADGLPPADVARDGAGAAVEQGRLIEALDAVRRDIEQTIAAAGARGDTTTGDVFRAHLELLDDPELRGAAAREIAAGRSAAWAWQAALQELATVLRGLDNPLLAERTGDLRDLERQTLARLAGGAGGRVPAALPDHAILIADELLPSELAGVPAGKLAGLATARGGATSHVAILAAGMSVPAVVAIGDAALRIPDGAPIIVDGTRGKVYVFPTPATRETTLRAIADRTARRRTALAAAGQRATTSDGVEIAMFANLGSVKDAVSAVERGAEGCGLLRTEFLFLDRQTAPNEDEQAACYQEIADALQGRPLVIRTLDAGGDKPLPYLPQAKEDNPALGVRGVRLALRHPALTRTQLRAILRVRGACRIMVPMIATLAELRAVRAMLDEEQRALGVSAPVQLGAMIEVPVAALIADTLARESDFFSIGTNDLSQYGLAMDRGNHDVATSLTSLHPGLLRLISSTVTGARTRGRPVAVCGGSAGDPTAVPVLLGLGVRTLSVAPALIPEVKALIRTLSLSQCTEVATTAIGLESSEAVRALVTKTWPAMAAHHD